jgi:purine-nucleoside phosphorylase
MDYYDRVQAAAEAIRAKVPRVPSIAVVLGSGLGDFAGALVDPRSLPYRDLPYWPPAGIPGHDGRLVVGSVRGRLILVLAGRSHVYEGHDLGAVTFAVRVLGVLGVDALILTNAAGGISARLSAGALMAIDDHINLTGLNPLIGPNEDRFGPRFPDMTQVYSTRLRAAADQAAAALDLPLAHGIYAAVTGPSYETAAEIGYLRTIGADAVGMSTVLEAIAARHMGLELLGISCITNMAAGVHPGPLSHQDVLETSRRAGARFQALLEGIIGRI